MRFEGYFEANLPTFARESACFCVQEGPAELGVLAELARSVRWPETSIKEPNGSWSTPAAAGRTRDVPVELLPPCTHNSKAKRAPSGNKRVSSELSQAICPSVCGSLSALKGRLCCMLVVFVCEGRRSLLVLRWLTPESRQSKMFSVSASVFSGCLGGLSVLNVAKPRHPSRAAQSHPASLDFFANYPRGG